MSDKDKPLDGEIAQGSRVFQIIKEECSKMDSFIWPAWPADVETIVVMPPTHFHHLNVYLRSINRLCADEEIGFMEDLKVTIIPLATADGTKAYTRPKER